MELNDPSHLVFFNANPEPGEVIIDETIPAIDAAGRPIARAEKDGVIPTVSYTVPADRSTMDRVVREAQLAAGRNAPSSLQLLMITVIITAVALILMVVFRRRF
jgi:hypothetical protein